MSDTRGIVAWGRSVHSNVYVFIKVNNNMENHGDGNSTSFNQFWHTTLTRSSSPAVPGGDSLKQGLIQYRHIDSIEMIHLKLLKLCTVQCTTQTFKVSTGLYFVSHLLSIRFHNFGCNGCVMSKPAEIQFGPWWKNCSKPFTCHSLQRFSSGAAGHTFHLPTCSDVQRPQRGPQRTTGPTATNALRSQRSCGTRSGSYFGTTCKVHQGATSQGTLKGQCQSLSRAQKFRSL